MPTCHSHLSPTAKAKWKPVARMLHETGLFTQIDRAVLAALCQADGRWVKAEGRLAETPPVLMTPAGYVQIGPWITIANKQVGLMTRLTGELCLLPAFRSRLAEQVPTGPKPWEWGRHSREAASPALLRSGAPMAIAASAG